MISIIDTGSGNILSISNMLYHLNYDHSLAYGIEDLEKSKIIILPGVGTFDYVVKELHEKKIFNFLKNKKNLDGKFLIGICVGMQVLFEKSEEGNLCGLSLINGNVKKFDTLHMGWNNIFGKTPEKNSSRSNYYYFAHNYYIDCDESNIVYYCNHSVSFPALVKKENIYGIQFHPEKSHLNGMSLLDNLISNIKKNKCY